MARLLEGKTLADEMKSGLELEFRALKKELNEITLVNIEIGDNPAARVYGNAQKRVADELGVVYQLQKIDRSIKEEELIKFIQKLNQDKTINGIIFQMPVPEHIDYKKVSRFIAVEKDIEGMHPQNVGNLLLGKGKIVPCTAASVMELIKATGIVLEGKDAVVVGHSAIVGKPVSLLLLDRLATVSVCHIATSKAGKLEEYVKKAEVLVVAVGKAGLIKGNWIKKDAVVIDVGINRVDDKIVGDVEFSSAEKKASWITPVPGGVGPLTVMMLMRNLAEAVKIQGRK